MSRVTVLLLLVLSVAASPAFAADAQTPQPVLERGSGAAQAADAQAGPLQLPEDDSQALLMEIVVGKTALDGLLTVFPVADTYFVPLSSFASAIDLAIEADTDNGIARGFVFNEARTFLLDVHRGELVLAGDTIRFDPARTGIRELDDIYVDYRLLSRWLPMRLELDLYGARLVLRPDQPLPFQQRLERERRMKRVSPGRHRQQTDYPRVEQGTELIDYPFINQTVRLGVSRNQQGTETQAAYSTYAAMDLLHMESNWYLAGDDDDALRYFRGTLWKRNLDPVLLPPLGAREYAFGHVSEPHLDLVNRVGTPLPGLYVSSYPLRRQDKFDSHTFEGDLPPGWEVELYRNNSLIGYQSQAQEGQYRFEDVPLLFGHNHFRVVLYGPMGQVREEVKTFELGESLTRDGEHHYRGLVSRDDNGRARGVLQYDGGISRSLSGNLSLVSIPLQDAGPDAEPWERHSYASLGLRGFFGGLFLRGDAIADLQGGAAMDVAAQARIGSLLTAAGQSWFDDDYISEEIPWSATRLTERRYITVDTSLPVSWLAGTHVGLAWNSSLYDNDVENNRLVNRISLNGSGFAAVNTLTLVRITDREDTVADSLQLSKRSRRFNSRAQFSWRLEPDYQLDAATLVVDGIRQGDYVLSVGGSRFVSLDYDEAFFSINRYHGRFALSLDARYGTGGVVNLGLSFSAGLSREPRSGQWQSDARPVAFDGALSARVFLDSNLNGIADEGEEGIPDSRVRLNGTPARVVANEQGIVYLTGLEPWYPLDLDVATETLGDPFLMPAQEGVQIVPRAGKATVLDIPVVPTGEIDGTAYIRLGSSRRHVSGALLELVNEQGQVVKTTKSAYDGFYLFSQVPLGNYRVRLGAAQLQRLNLRPMEPREVQMTLEQPVVNGVDFILERE